MYREDTHIEAISAMEELTNRNPIQHTKNIQIVPAVPPLTSPIVETLQLSGSVSQPLTRILLSSFFTSKRIPKMPLKSWKSRRWTRSENFSVRYRVSAGQKGTDIGTNRHFLGFAHTIHVGAIGRSSLL